MHVADLIHGTLPLLVNGAYVPPLLFGHSRKMMNHDHIHPPNSACSRRPLILTRLKEEHSTFPHMSCPACPLVCHPGLYTACLCHFLSPVLCRTQCFYCFCISCILGYCAMGLSKT